MITAGGEGVCLPIPPYPLPDRPWFVWIWAQKDMYWLRFPPPLHACKPAPPHCHTVYRNILSFWTVKNLDVDLKTGLLENFLHILCSPVGENWIVWWWPWTKIFCSTVYTDVFMTWIVQRQGFWILGYKFWILICMIFKKICIFYTLNYTWNSSLKFASGYWKKTRWNSEYWYG